MYPPCQHFISTRLESFKKKDNFIRGLVCLMNDTPVDTTRINTIHTLFHAIHDRCVNELNQFQAHEKLIIARDLATLDAENKLKFLADMSHEIR